jgi:hypothetical protein
LPFARKFEINNDLKNCRLLWDALKVEIREITMTFSKIKVKETRELTRTLEKTLEAKLACSDTVYHLKLNYLSSKNPYLFLPHLTRNLRIHFDDLYI